jgi:hypothetical protein
MFTFKEYKPHKAQRAFHHYINNVYRFIAMICGIRAGKTYSGAREAIRQAWNSKQNGVFGIVAPTFQMLKRTTWREFELAAKPLILRNNGSDKIITLKNGREVHGFSADNPDRIRNATLCGFWLDEGRECKDGIWDVLLGRVLSTGGKGFVTTSPNSFDWLHNIFIENRKKGYGVLRFSTYENENIPKEAIDELKSLYDEKFAQQELMGEFVVFEGAVYYTFNRTHNAGDLAFKIANYDRTKPLCLTCDFNVDPMAWVVAQVHHNNGLQEIRVIDELYLRNSNTMECCREFKNRYPNHTTGLMLYGDATGQGRTSNSNRTNWQIIEQELAGYGLTSKVRRSNPPERDRINTVNGLMCNSNGQRRIQVNPQKCKHLIRDLEQVAYKEGSSQIDKTKDKHLTHISDALGYFITEEFPMITNQLQGLKI